MAGVAAVLLLAGCGSAVRSAGAPVVPDTTAPPITALNEPAPDEVFFFFDHDFEPAAGSAGMCVVSWGTDVVGNFELPTSEEPQECPEPPAEEKARMEADRHRYEEAIRPAPDSPPRVLAKLALQDGGHVLFTAWRNGAGALCWQTDEITDDGSSGGGPSGPCKEQAYPDVAFGAADFPRCDDVCLESGNSDSGDYVLTGTVAADADAIRITRAGGAVATYALEGPVVPGSDRRVFMLELGPRDWRTLELVHGGDVVETVQMPAFMAAYEDCRDTVGPMPEPPAERDEHAMLDQLRAYSNEINACVRASGALPATSFP